jgi:hypothetical protein
MGATDAEREIINLLKRIAVGVEMVAGMRTTAPPAVQRIDLDGPHGNPTVKAKDPRDWTGEPMHGRTFSECPAAYLDLLADRLEYFASKEDDPKKKRYNKLDAARARGWAERVRNGEVAAPAKTGDAWAQSRPPQW